jgi:hypothetical protein
MENEVINTSKASGLTASVTIFLAYDLIAPRDKPDAVLGLKESSKHKDRDEPVAKQRAHALAG